MRKNSPSLSLLQIIIQGKIEKNLETYGKNKKENNASVFVNIQSNSRYLVM